MEKPMPKLARQLLLSLLPLVSLASSARAEPRKPTHVACVGDSITAGMGASSTDKNYVSQLQTLLGNSVQVKNFGNSGSTLLGPGYGDKPYVQQTEYTAATSFVSGAGANAVVSVVIMLGTNDSKPQNWEPTGKPKNDQQFASYYKALIDHFQGLSTKPTVYIALPVAAYANSYGISGDVIHDQELPLIRQVAADKRVPLVDLNTGTLNHPEYFGDGVHPNDSGYTVMANLVKQGLARQPTVHITSPAMGATLGAGMLALAADASADTIDISSIEFFEGQISLGKATSKPSSVMWGATSGPHTITAKAIDATLANATSDPLSFNVGVAGGAGQGGSAGATNGAGADTGGAATGGNPSGGGGSAGGITQAGSTNAGVSGGGAAAATGPGGGSSTSGAGNSSAKSPVPGSQSDESCSCAVPGTRQDSGASWLAVTLLTAFFRRRRDRRRMGSVARALR